MVDDGNKEDGAGIPVLTLSHVSALLAPLLRQTMLARFPTVARAPTGRRQPRNSGTGSSSDSLTANSFSSSPTHPMPTEAKWAYVHATEGPAVRAWWATILQRLPVDAAFATANAAGLNSAEGGVFAVPGVRCQIDWLLQSAQAMSAHAFNLRFSAAHECLRAAHLSATLCGMDWIRPMYTHVRVVQCEWCEVPQGMNNFIWPCL